MANPMPCESQASPWHFATFSNPSIFSHGCAVPATLIAGFCCFWPCLLTHLIMLLTLTMLMGFCCWHLICTKQDSWKAKGSKLQSYSTLLVQKIHTPASKSQIRVEQWRFWLWGPNSCATHMWEANWHWQTRGYSQAKPQYPALKSMADADHEVSAALAINSYDLLTQSIQSPRDDATTDIRLIFQQWTRNTRTLILGWSRMDIGVNSVCSPQFSFSSTCLIVAIN